MEEILQTLRDILSEKLGIQPASVTPEAHLVKDLGIDSLDYIEIIMELEQVYNMSIPETDSEHFKTVEDVMLYIHDKKLKKTA
ncbi:MAG: acyl carrier protein [Thermonema sp.]|jgi:acyl carrier protein|uniref:acyl carrier protein n=1 Tax=Thermonema TaxID=28194 RepID=UPI000571944C|nr:MULTISPECIES: acyl carrier protein [Thermonema]GIV38900.1 MAG: acyl carrier protein [Thermonema sp.]